MKVHYFSFSSFFNYLLNTHNVLTSFSHHAILSICFAVFLYVLCDRFGSAHMP